MKKIILISCVKTKQDKKTEAEFLYTSDLFKSSLKYAKQQKPDNIFILSAKYGLLKLSDKIEPYEKTLNNLRKNERIDWAKSVIEKLKNLTNLEKDEFIFLVGKKYREFLIPELVNIKIPMKDLGFGKQLQWLKKNTENEK